MMKRLLREVYLWVIDHTDEQPDRFTSAPPDVADWWGWRYRLWAWAWAGLARVREPYLSRCQCEQCRVKEVTHS